MSDQEAVVTESELKSVLGGIADGLKPTIRALESKIEALERSNRSLHDRVLELEADRAAAPTPTRGGS